MPVHDWTRVVARNSERLADEQNLPVMPLFLTSEEYINFPLQETYDEAWRGVPARWKSVLEAPKTS